MDHAKFQPTMEVNAYKDKLQQTIVPEVSFVDADAIDAIGYISRSSTLQHSDKFINVIFFGKRSDYTTLPKITLRKKNLSFLELLSAISDMAGLVYRIEREWVYIGKQIRDTTVIVQDSAMAKHLEKIKMEQVDFREAKLDDIFRYLQIYVEEFSESPDVDIPEVQFVNITAGNINPPPASISLQVGNVSILSLLEILTQLAPLEISLKNDIIEYTLQ